MTEQAITTDYRWRRWSVLSLLMVAAIGLGWRAFDLQVLSNDFLKREGQARHLRTVKITAHRGKLLDRNGTPLAVSTPVDSVWMNPKEVDTSSAQWTALVRVLGLDAERTESLVASRGNREFLYLRRHVTPDLALQVRAFGVEGVYLQREYRRYYPSAELTSHVIGFTNVDDRGQEGIELAYDDSLTGVDGRETVVKDRKGAVVETVQTLREMRAGRDLNLSIDRRVQYFAYRALAVAMKKHRARAASAVVLDVDSGEVLAMVNQPTYNPNKRADRVSARFRNRAITDQFEPGSTIKPFTVAAALSSGRIAPSVRIDTSPGVLTVAGHTVRDVRNHGVVDLGTLIMKSSNVGATKLALSMPPESLWSMLDRVGFGSSMGIGFPGETEGVLPHHFEWREIQRVTLSFGYGLSVSALQLARAYAAIANGGVLPEVTLLRRDEPARGERVLDAAVAREVRQVLELVVRDDGTGRLARVHGYRIGGKTGTVRKPVPGGYAEDRYMAIFAGIAPASAPRLSVVVVVDEPRGKQYYGGDVAAPIFAEITAGALRVLGIPPDTLEPAHDAGAVERIAQSGSSRARAKARSQP